MEQDEKEVTCVVHAPIPSFELFYGTGGHGGPYFGLAVAIEAANGLMIGHRAEHTIKIVDRLTNKTVARVVRRLKTPETEIVTLPY